MIRCTHVFVIWHSTDPDSHVGRECVSAWLRCLCAKEQKRIHREWNLQTTWIDTQSNEECTTKEREGLFDSMGRVGKCQGGASAPPLFQVSAFAIMVFRVMQYSRGILFLLGFWRCFRWPLLIVSVKINSSCGQRRLSEAEPNKKIVSGRTTQPNNNFTCQFRVKWDRFWFRWCPNKRWWL